MPRPQALRLMREHLQRLHEEIERSLLVQPDDHTPTAVEQIVDRMWTLGQSVALSPHQCNDRYCYCHLVIRDGEPVPLFGDPNGW